ncbi:hypothetical protein CerSpe_248720 [Prunus speciosa]
MAFANKVVNVDRLSALPHEIALHILSFLSISDLTRVGILSHRFRALYLSTPILSFTEFPSESIRTSNKRLELMSSSDRFFTRRGQNKVQSFSLYWVCEYHFRETATQRCCSVEKSRIMPWIENAVNCNVEKLHV